VARLKTAFNSGPAEEEVSAFARAAVQGDNDFIAEFLGKYPDAVDVRSGSGDAALLLAAWNGRRETAEQLLEHGAEIDRKNDWRGRTALMMAAGYGHREVVELLLDKGAAIDLEDKDGWTAIMLAHRHERPDMAALLEAGLEKQRLAKEAQQLAAKIAEYSPKLKRDLPAPRPLVLKRKTP